MWQRRRLLILTLAICAALLLSTNLCAILLTTAGKLTALYELYAELHTTVHNAVQTEGQEL